MTEILFSDVMARFYWMANTVGGWLFLIIVGMPIGGWLLMLVFRQLKLVINGL